MPFLRKVCKYWSNLHVLHKCLCILANLPYFVANLVLSRFTLFFLRKPKSNQLTNPINQSINKDCGSDYHIVVQLFSKLISVFYKLSFLFHWFVT